jgi:hypothetical protein
MTSPQQFKPAEFVPVFVKLKKSSREQLRFLPRCGRCSKILFDVSEANLVVVEGDAVRLTRIAPNQCTKISRLVGRAFIFCWSCDGELMGTRVPWQNALGTFRGLDEPQRFPEPVRVGRQR